MCSNCMYVCRYILYSLNTDDIYYTIKTLSVCMYVCMYVCNIIDDELSADGDAGSVLAESRWTSCAPDLMYICM